MITLYIILEWCQVAGKTGEAELDDYVTHLTEKFFLRNINKCISNKVC
jgi:hypothetical protein